MAYVKLVRTFLILNSKLQIGTQFPEDPAPKKPIIINESWFESLAIAVEMFLHYEKGGCLFSILIGHGHSPRQPCTVQ
jgi:hypothetical protein